MANTTVRAITGVKPRSGLRGLAIAVGLGCLWGLAEATLGTSLHVDQVPLAGQILIPIGICCALSAYRFYPLRGSVMAVGVAAAAVRFCAPGPFLPMPALAILLEAGLMELCLLLLGGGRAGFAVAGAAAAAYPLLHAFLFKTLFFGLPLAGVYSGVIRQARAILPFPSLGGATLLALWTVLCLALSGAVGFAFGALFSPDRAPRMRRQTRLR